MSNDKKLPDILLDVFDRKYLPIYFPIIIGTCLFTAGILVSMITNKLRISDILIGISSLFFASSGIWQIKLRKVPGYPALQGGCAIAFGIFFIILFSLFGIGILFYE